MAPQSCFVLNLGLMFDVLEELSDFSLSLQDRSMTLHRADALLRRQIRVLKSLAASPGLRTQEAQQAVELNIFETVTLEQRNVGGDCAINQGLFLIPWLEVLSKEWGVYQGSCVTETNIISSSQILNPSSLPTGQRSLG